MTEVLAQQIQMDAIEKDLNERAENPLEKQVAGTAPAEQQAAWAQMTGTMNGDDRLPGLALVADQGRGQEQGQGQERGQGQGQDNLHPAEIEVGGYNAVVAAKVPAQGEGVLTVFGHVYEEALKPGLHMKYPWQHVYMMPTNLIANTVRAQAGSHDLQQITTQVTIPFHMNEGYGPKVFSKIGTLEKVEAVVINPGVLECLKAVCARYTAEELITKRQQVKEEVELALKGYISQALKERGLENALSIGIIAITDFRFSDEYNKSIELKVKAAQDALRAESEKKQRITEAEGLREATKAKADGEAYATEVRSIAEAGAIRRRAEALKVNPALIDLNAIEKWDGKVPVYQGGGTPIPFINVPKPEMPKPAAPTK
jgi:regulator of protease activity HflC (stomatin/prohibitin superfamily)